MSTTYTPNYHLGKQENRADRLDMGIVAANMDTIDAQLKATDDKANAKQAALSSAQLAAVNSGITAEDVEQIGINQTNILTLMTPKKGDITWATGYEPTNAAIAIRQYGNIVVGQIYATWSSAIPTTETIIGTITGVDRTRTHYRGIGYTANALYSVPTDTVVMYINGNNGQLALMSGSNAGTTLRFNFVYCTSDPS